MLTEVRPSGSLAMPSFVTRGAAAQRPIPALGTFGGSATAMTAVDPTGAGVYFNGQTWWATFAQTNGAAATLNVSTYGAYALTDDSGVALPTGFIDTTRRYLVRVSTSGGNKIMLLGAAEAIARAAADNAAAVAIDAVEADVDALDPSFRGARFGAYDVPLALRQRQTPSINFAQDEGFDAFMFGVNPPRDARLAAIGVWLRGLHHASFLRVKVWTRPLADGDGTGPYELPGDHTGDVLISNILYPTEDLIPNGKELQTEEIVRLPLNLSATASQIVFVSMQGLDSDGTTPVGIGPSKGPNAGAATPYWPRGWRTNSSIPVTSNLATTLTLAYILFEEGRDPRQGPAATPPFERVEIVGSYDKTQSPSSSLVTPALSIVRDGEALPVASQTTAIGAGDTYVITQSSLAISTVAVLSYHHISRSPAPLVTPAGGGTPLVEGTDYEIVYDQGWIRRLGTVAMPSGNYDVTFTGARERYDRIHVDAATGVVGTTVGTDHLDAASEFLPAVPVGKISIFNVHVHGTHAELIPVCQFDDMWPIGRQAEREDWLRYCRERLPNNFSRLRQAQAITLMGYGDSTTKLGYETASDELNANTIEHDHKDYFATMPAEVTSTIPLVSGTGGTVHHHLGPNWAVQAQMTRWGSTVTYKNRGVGGTTSEATLVGGVDYNGLHATRLAAAIADSPHLVIINFGTNEWGSLTTEANIQTMAAAFIAAGAEVIVEVPPRSGAWNVPGVHAAQYTQAALIRAARRANVAYCPSHLLTAPGREGATGLSAMSLAACNRASHPGPYELACRGRLLASIFA